MSPSYIAWVTLFVLLDHAGEKSPVVLLQYLFKYDELDV